MLGADVISTSCPISDDSIRPTPAMVALGSTIEYSISLPVMVQEAPIEVDGPM